jgi:oxygen-independent coproporphyrinogen-3 oxidase
VDDWTVRSEEVTMIHARSERSDRTPALKAPAAQPSPGSAPALDPPVPTTRPASTELARRMAGPQRHRLLQGYPMLPVMRSADPERPLGDVSVDAARRLIVGVLPHPFCNPQVTGCGFCTFPHEAFRRSAADATTIAVAAEVRARTAARPALRGRRVDALYFGGGTANLTPPDAFRHLGAALTEAFDLGGAELSFEGVPRYFLARGGDLLEAFDALPARHRRLSMGVQTFQPAWIERMGRRAFGGRAEVAQVVQRAHARGMTASCDLLINLPGQPLADMLEDVRTAAALGLDQICVYHLVLFEGLGTAWSRDPAMLAARPSNEAAFRNWQAVRRWLLAHGYVQSTLTNFERAEVASSPRRFVYEELSFRPEQTDGIGFGPGGITCFTDSAGGRAIKLVNAAGSEAYRAEVTSRGTAFDRAFRYAARDLRLLHLTRTLARLEVDRATYRTSLGTDPLEDFPGAFGALADADLVTIDDRAVRLTERGMFYADAVAGLLAWRRVDTLRARRRLPMVRDAEGQPIQDLNRSGDFNMG